MKEKRKAWKQERKANRIITLDHENSQKVELQHWSQKLHIEGKQIHCQNDKAPLNEKLTDSLQ